MKYITYRYLSCEINHGTAENSNIEQVILEKILPYNENTLAIAKQEALDGVYTLEEREDPPALLTLEERIIALEKNISAKPFTSGTWYYRGDRISFEEKVFTCIAPEGVVCVWSPQEYPQYWTKAE